MKASYLLMSLWDMYQVDVSAYHKAIVMLTQISEVAGVDTPQTKEAIPERNAFDIFVVLKGLEKTLAPLNIPVTKLTLKELKRNFEQSPIKIGYPEFGQLALNLNETLRRELKTNAVFVLEANRVEFFEPSAPLFGKKVAVKFPTIAYEIEQAGKCYACDLTTASAFHTIRCLEAGIRAVARCLGIPDPTRGKDRNWSNISRAIKEVIDLKWPASTGRMDGDAQFFDEIHGALAAMQNPYRNATMHLDAVYTAPEAKHIFEVVKGLMVRIADRMDEEGAPLA